MPRIVFVASHLGYPIETTPLGGGAAVGYRLAQQWAHAGAEIIVLGSGSKPVPGVRYVQLPPGAADPDLVRLSEQGYASFCRVFEAATTEHILKTYDPKDTVLVCNDVAEGPDFERLSSHGFPIASLWHVDVVEFFNRVYLRGIVRPERLTKLFSRLSSRLLPEILRIVFDKQRRAVHHSDLMVVPSRQMADSLKRCYPELSLEGRILVHPWGGWDSGVPEAQAAEEAERLKQHYQLKPESRVLMTMSRISPEKGIHLLLDALRMLEGSSLFDAVDVCLFICGEPAFMRGETYARRVRRAAERLHRFRVFFPGHLSPAEKQAYFRLAQLFVSPSIHESYGLTLVEAMRAGLPILASDHYGVDETVRPEYGRTVSYAGGTSLRAPRLASALEELLAAPGELAKMGARAAEAAKGMSFDESARLLRAAVLKLLDTR
ncbi:MAG: glycosyltransferase family 4 protein [Elusimicrobiota bacterium]